jgi:hypothetical protein
VDDEAVGVRLPHQPALHLEDEPAEAGRDLPKPVVLAEEIADDLEAALEQFQAVAAKLKTKG